MSQFSSIAGFRYASISSGLHSLGKLYSTVVKAGISFDLGMPRGRKSLNPPMPYLYILVDFALEEGIWQRAATAFADYAERRRKSSGGKPKRLLADFVIGAYAVLSADCLMTLEAGRYRSDFPSLRIV